jgi:uncharacterized damage-inducible protein DinB
MQYQFLIDTYETERLKVLSTWSMFSDEDLPVRPHPTDPRGRSVLEQMVHQCLSESNWFVGMLGIVPTSIDAAPLPSVESRLGFIERYAEDSQRRFEALRGKDDAWWEEEVAFFDVRRSRAWVMVRRIAHSAHHRGQQLAMLRMLGRELYSNYGPTADTGGLAQNGALVIYPYPDAKALVACEAERGRKPQLPGVGSKPSTERP